MGWQLIESQSLQSSAASVTFSNIPQTYKSLKLVVSHRTDLAANADDVKMTVNAIGSGYSARQVGGNGSTTFSTSTTAAGLYAGFTVSNSATGNTFSSTEITIPNYSGSTNKPWSVDTVTENNGTSASQALQAGLLSNTSAITSLSLAPFTSSNFVFGSTFTLYGLA